MCLSPSSSKSKYKSGKWKINNICSPDIIKESHSNFASNIKRNLANTLSSVQID